MKNKMKRFLLSVMSGVLILNSPLAVLAETSDTVVQNSDSAAVTDSSELSQSSEESKYSFEDAVKSKSLYDFLSKMETSDRYVFLSGLDQKQVYQLATLLKYDYISNFSKNKKFNLYKELVKHYYDNFTHQLDETSDEKITEEYNQWNAELLSLIGSEEQDVSKYEEVLITSKEFDAKGLMDLFNYFFVKYPSIMEQTIKDEEKEKQISQYGDKLFEFQTDVFGSKEDVTYSLIENIYQMDVTGENYELVDTKNEEITSRLLRDSDIIKDYEGFSFAYYTINDNGDKITEFDSDNIQSGETLNIYYSRNQYSIVAQKGEGIKEITSDKDLDSLHYYGEEIELTATVENGYKWKEWTTPEGEALENGKEETYKVTVPVNGINIMATAEKKMSLARTFSRAARSSSKIYDATSTTTVYVDGNYGNDSSAGTYSAPFRSLKKAYQALQSTGGVISFKGNVTFSNSVWVYDNYYADGTTTVTLAANKHVKFVRYSGAGQGLKFIGISGAKSTIYTQGLIYDGYNYSGVSLGFISVGGGASIYATNCEFRNSNNKAEHGTGVAPSGFSSAIEFTGSGSAYGQFSGCTFSNCFSEGGSAIIARNNYILVDGCTFKNNSGYVDKNGNLISGSAPLELIDCPATVTGCTFENNKMISAGCIITFGTKDLTVKNSTFTGNNAVNGSCIILVDGNTCKIDSSSFTNNTSSGTGCIQSGEKTKLYVQNDNVFTGNTAGVGAAISAYGYLKINQVATFEENKSGNGGAVWVTGSEEFYLDHSYFNNNKAGSGGAIYRTGTGKTTIYNTEFNGNSAESAYYHYGVASQLGAGGAIEFYSAGIATINGSIFKNNAAKGESGYGTGDGGAINAFSTDLSIVSYNGNIPTFDGNKSDYCGGAITASGSLGKTLNVSDATLSNNSSMHGGALYLSCTADIHGNTKITNNTAKYGGAIWNIGAKTTVRSATSIKDNTATGWGNAIGSTASSTLNFQGNLTVDKDNDVFLYDGAVITVNGAITNNDFLCTITPETYTIKKTVVTVSHDSKKASDDLFKSDGTVRFQLTPKSTYTLRPGDYIDTAEKVSTKDIIISTYYNVYFDKNSNDEVTNLPDTQHVYWREVNKLSDKVLNRDLYEFLEWNTASDKTGTTYKPGSNISLSGDLTLYAQWKALGYTVKFHANGGTGSMDNVTPFYGKDYTLPGNTFTREGYTFKDWLDKNRSTTWKNKGTINYTKDQTNNGVVDLYAEWDPIEYDITYDSNKPASASGTVTGSTASSHHKYDESKNLTANGYKLTGWTFTGWNTKKDGSGQTYSDKQAVKNLTTENEKKITLYAQWRPNTYTVTYNSNKPKTNSSITGYTLDSNHTYDVAKNLTANGYSLSGWTFNGWNTKADGSGKHYDDKESVKNLTATDGGNVILYAQWVKNSYPFDLNGYLDGKSSGNIAGYGTVDIYVDGKLVADDVTDFYQNIPFESTYEIKDIKPTTGHSYNGPFSGTVKGTMPVGGASTTLNFTTNKYNIVFDGNGSTSGSMDKMSNLVYDQKYNLNQNRFEKTGYTFTGWKDESTGKTYENGAEVTKLRSDNGATVTLKAQWRANTYTVNYEGNKPSTASHEVTGSTASSNHVYDEAKNLTPNGFKLVGWTFTGWKDGKGNSYSDKQSVKNLTSKDKDVVTMKAQWKANTYTIHYDENGATSGSTADSNMTYDTPGSLNKNGFKKDGATFIGWKDEKGNSYKDGQTVSNLTPDDKGVIKLIAQWDLAPEIKANDKTYYEGMTVTRADLLKDVTANDKEDGVITNKLIITKIEYSKGKVVNGKKQAAYTQEWANGMPADATLDTWFMQLDKADSPVKHKVTYKVVDSVGNVTTKTVNVYVKYNNAPVITTIDRYYTLKEAQSGVISAEELLKNSITSNKMKSTDIEEGDLSSKVELVDFNPADFTKLTTSATVTVTYRVHDSYGPNGVGKETINQFVVHITDPDGDDPVRPGMKETIVKHVRFITKKYYDLNKDKKDKDFANDTDLAKANANGGLRVGCSWYSDPDYKSEITATFDKTSGTTYKFSHEDVEKIQDYINQHGIGNAKETDSLSNFYQTYLNK